MGEFTKDKKNEFKRDKGEKSDGLSFSFIHKIVPFAMAVLSLIVSTQMLAYRLGYSVQYLGYPWFSIGGYPVYYPYLIFVLTVRGISLTPGSWLGSHIFNSTMVLLIGITCSVVTYFILTWARTAAQKDQNIHGTSRWATKKDIEAVGLFQDSGVVIGQEESAKVDYAITGGGVKLKLVRPSDILRHSGQTSTMMFAPTRSGKGVSSVIPTCIDWPGSLITIDPKGENFNITAGWRGKFSHVLRISPCSKDTLKFNILDELESSSAYRNASTIAEILTTPPDGRVDGSSKHWVDTARDLLTGAILHVKCSDYRDKSLYGVLSFLSQANGDDGKTTGLLDGMIGAYHCTPEIHEIVSNVARRNKTRPDDERGSVFSTAVTALQVFEDPLVRNCSSSSDFCLNDFKVCEHPISLYVTVPFPDLDRLSSYIRIIVTFILRKFSQDETQFGEQKLAHPILFLIDEFPTLGTFTALETMMGILAGYGITFYLICQTPNQLYKLYGQETSIFDHCKFIMTYAMSDTKASEMFSKMLGVKSVTYSNTSTSGSRFDAGQNNINSSVQTTQVNLMNADEIQHLPGNQLLVFPQGAPPILAKKNVYYSDPRYKEKVNLPPPKDRAALLKECAMTTKPDLAKKQWYHIPEEMYMSSEDVIVEPLFASKIPDDDEELKKLAQNLRVAVI